MQQKDQSLRILVVVVHPHDFTHCAGTCGIHTARGDSVTVVSITDGSSTHNERLHDELLKPEKERDARVINQTAQEYAEGKAREFRKVCALFGVTDARVLAFPQPFRLKERPEAVEALRDIMYDVRPHVLITQSPYLSGPHGMASAAYDDHGEAARTVMEAKALAAVPDYVTKERPHTIAATYYLGIYFMRDEIDFYVDISEWKEQRVQAEGLFRSQGHTDAFALRRVEIAAGNIGWYAGTAYAESFVRAVPEVLPRIIVAESALKRASEPRENHMKRLAGALEKDSVK